MKLKIASVEYEKKLADWFEKYPNPSETCTDQKIVDAIDRAAAMYESFGKEDAAAGKPAAEQKIFQTLGTLCFPNSDDSSMAVATADYMKKCYLDGYRNGGAV